MKKRLFEKYVLDNTQNDTQNIIFYQTISYI